MTYALVSNSQIIEYPVYEGDIRAQFPNTSFPIPFDPPAGYVRVEDTVPPNANWDQSVVEDLPQFKQGKLVRVWNVIDASASEIAERTGSQASAIRIERNSRLAATDWTQLPDSPVDASAWTVYRQALRDITAQDGFPWTVTWPTEPQG